MRDPKTEQRIVHETRDYFVTDEGQAGYRVWRNTFVAAERCASIGHGPAPQLGITRAIAECNRRQAEGGGQ